jgi:hypothetical protein
MKPKQFSCIAEPPLEVRHTTRLDRETRGKVRITTVRRGILKSETRTYDSNSIGTGLKRLTSVPPKQEFERMCETLRDRLEKWGLPSDRQPRWVKRPGHDWEPYVDENHRDIKGPVSYALWWARIKALTEELSEKRQTGEALWQLLRLLERDGIVPHLWHVGQTISAISTLRIAGSMNAMATAGIAARKGRTLGPAAKQAKAAARQDIVFDVATKFWTRSPKYSNDANNTANVIQDDVNERLLEDGLWPREKAGMSAKTIADHIRGILRGKRFALASSEA